MKVDPRKKYKTRSGAPVARVKVEVKCSQGEGL
jgi:hypothetical protein